MASGTVQPDVRSMSHALKGTGYSLDIDHTKMDEIENMLNEGMAEYDFNPVTTTADRVPRGIDFDGLAKSPDMLAPAMMPVTAGKNRANNTQNPVAGSGADQFCCNSAASQRIKPPAKNETSAAARIAMTRY